MIYDHDELAPAVLFFGADGLISKQMNYSEFEALLDNYVPAIDFAGQVARAVFIEIDSLLRLRTSVFFTVPFTPKGAVAASWNLPLDQLAKNAMRGPDLGAGPIRLVCESLCPIQYFRDSLWNPDLRPGRNQLQLIAKVLKRNKLAIQFNENPDQEAEGREAAASSLAAQNDLTEKLRREYAKEYRDHMAQLLSDQRLQIETLTANNEKAVNEVKLEHASRIAEYRSLIDEKNQLIEEEKDRNKALKETIEGQAKKIEGLREYFEHKLEQAEGPDNDLVQMMKENFEAETEAKVEAAITELKEIIQMRDVELMYRNEQEIQLRSETARLRKENQALLGSSDNEILGKMAGKGISFVSYQPGAGHITIPTVDIAIYMDNPVAYAASQCGVSEQHYSAWLQHYQAPVCTASDADGNICGENLDRVDNPADFQSGDQDRCHDHKEIDSAETLKIVSG